jgi:hypothetical protein
VSEPKPPRIQSVGTHLATLARRREFLDQALDERRGSEASLRFMAAEVDALAAAETALKLHRAIYELLPEPLGLLKEVITHHADAAKMRALAKRAALVLEEFE